MRSLFRLDGKEHMTKLAEDKKHPPDVARFLKELELIDEGEPNPAREELLSRLVAASKNVQDYIRSLDVWQLSSNVTKVLANLFNQGNPWVVALALDDIRQRREVVQFVRHAFKEAASKGSFGPQHSRIAEALLAFSGSFDDEELEFLKNMRTGISASMVAGSMPPEVYAEAVNRLTKDGACPWWALDWLQSTLRSEKSGDMSEIPPWLAELVKAEIAETDPRRRRDELLSAWMGGLMSRKEPPEWMVQLLSARYAETGHIPSFAYDWLRKMIASATTTMAPLPDAIVRGIEVHLATTGDASFADPYVEMALENGYATPKMQEIYEIMVEVFEEHVGDPSSSPLDKDHTIPEWFPRETRARLRRQMMGARQR